MVHPYGLAVVLDPCAAVPTAATIAICADVLVLCLRAPMVSPVQVREGRNVEKTGVHCDYCE